MCGMNCAYTINIIEQAGTAPFNRGKLANCGFALTQDSAEYICIHGIDHLPMWADYSWSPNPARLIWQGLTLKEDWNNFFGARRHLHPAAAQTCRIFRSGRVDRGKAAAPTRSSRSGSRISLL